jgi:hypothetical protein
MGCVKDLGQFLGVVDQAAVRPWWSAAEQCQPAEEPVEDQIEQA